MKKNLLLILIICVVFLVGCGKKNEKDIVKDITKTVNNTKGYYLEGEMDIINNEDTYKYDVKVSYEKDNNFKVSLTNKANNHEQIILKNSDGVYVLTPALNKSFKFQSEWPYNNSQIYLLQSLINDLENDKNTKMEEKDGMYLLKSGVNYPNNNNLKNQIIYLDKNLNFKEVHVLDDNNIPQIKMKFNKIDMKSKFDSNHFALENNMKTSATDLEFKEVTKIDSTIYPMYMPTETHLSAEDKVNKSNGERLILTFEGENPFILVEETVDMTDEHEIIPVVGEPILLVDTVAAITDTSISWVSNGIEYYIVSDVVEQDELLNIARSLSVVSIEK